MSTEDFKMGKWIGTSWRDEPRGFYERAHSRVYMPSVLSLMAQSRTDVRSIAHQSSTSTSSSRAISKSTEGSKLTKQMGPYDLKLKSSKLKGVLFKKVLVG